jgi:hypothetical protein
MTKPELTQLYAALLDLRLPHRLWVRSPTERDGEDQYEVMASVSCEQSEIAVVLAFAERNDLAVKAVNGGLELSAY